MKTLKRRTFSGAVCEQIVWRVSDRVQEVSKKDVKPRFKNEEERKKHSLEMSRRKHAQRVNANFCPGDLYSTLTFDVGHEVHTFEEARRIRDNFVRRLKYAQPDAVIFIYMGRGKSTDRVHFHMLSHGIPQELIERQWPYGSVKRFSKLRAHNYYDGKDHGADYTGIANYLFDHWSEEQGGHRWKQTKNAVQPDAEDATLCLIDYSEARPPRPPKGYILVSKRETAYGYCYFKYVVDPKINKKRTG